MLGINHVLFVNMKIKRVVGVLGVVRVAAQGFRPVNDFPDVFNQGLAFRQVLNCKNAFTMHARAACLNAAADCDGGCHASS